MTINIQLEIGLVWETSHIYLIYCTLYIIIHAVKTQLFTWQISFVQAMRFHLARLGLDGGSADLRLCRRLSGHCIESFTSLGWRLASFYPARIGPCFPYSGNRFSRGWCVFVWNCPPPPSRPSLPQLLMTKTKRAEEEIKLNAAMVLRSTLFIHAAHPLPLLHSEVTH